jgi:pimeloyl-ACP methyl ester carboxylesterase
MWAISSSFGPHTPEQWLQLSKPMLKPVKNDRGQDVFSLHYDPAIATPFASVTQEMAAQGEALLWQAYDAITAQTLLLRGANSDLLSTETAKQMTERGPRARLVEFDGVGHAPTLIASDQVDAVVSFLLAAQ